VTRPHPALLRVAEWLIIPGATAAIIALVARLAHADHLILRLLDGGALLLATGAYCISRISSRTDQRATNSSFAVGS
jgi:hypothetical protein